MIRKRLRKINARINDGYIRLYIHIRDCCVDRPTDRSVLHRRFYFRFLFVFHLIHSLRVRIAVNLNLSGLVSCCCCFAHLKQNRPERMRKRKKEIDRWSGIFYSRCLASDWQLRECVSYLSYAYLRMWLFLSNICFLVSRCFKTRRRKKKRLFSVSVACVAYSLFLLLSTMRKATMQIALSCFNEQVSYYYCCCCGWYNFSCCCC